MSPNNTLIELINQHGTPSLFLLKNKIKNACINLQKALPGVKLFYALKPNSHSEILHVLKNQGIGFDICSNAEIDKILQANINPKDCIHTHPIKTIESIQYAYDKGIRTFVIDNLLELEKFKSIDKNIRLLIRIAIKNKKVITDFSKKFGVTTFLNSVQLISKTHSMGFRNIGISFHCGSQSIDSSIFTEALQKCETLIDAVHEMSIPITTVDIGGGFPIHYGSSTVDIENYCSSFRPLLQKIKNRGIEIIAEPGRFIAGNSMILVTKIIGKSIRDNKTWYYIDEGVYNSFSGQIFDNVLYPVNLLNETKDAQIFASAIAGQTCDSIDVIRKKISLTNLSIGDIFIFSKMGAYTSESACNFNGFEKTKIVPVHQI